MRIGFDNKLYIQKQTENILARIDKFKGKLYLEFGGKLFDDYHAARVLPGRPQDWEELTADVFLSAWEHRKALRPEQIRGWLGKVARNRALNRLRASREVLALEEDVLCLAEDGPQRLLEEREQAELVRRALGELERPDRELFVRHYYYGQTVARAAEEMGLNPSTAKTRLRRGREKLKEHLRKAGFCVEEAEDLKPDERVSGSGE